MTDKIEDGGPAFPHNSDNLHFGTAGMSLRDKFAMAALTGLLARDEWNNVMFPAKWAYEHADAMMIAREGDSK